MTHLSRSLKFFNSFPTGSFHHQLHSMEHTPEMGRFVGLKIWNNQNSKLLTYDNNTFTRGTIPWKKILRQLYVYDGKRWLKNPNLFPTLFFLSSRCFGSSWRRHFGFAIISQASSANFPDKLDRWRHIRNRLEADIANIQFLGIQGRKVSFSSGVITLVI